MFTRIIFAVVTTIAIGIGYHQYLGGSLVIFGQTCHRRFSQPFKYMATKTPYIDDGLDVEASSGDPFKTYHGGSCQPVLSWHIVRHGTRRSGVKVLRTMKIVLPRIKEQILEGHQNGKGSLCEDELTELKNWDPENLPLEQEEKFLTQQGELELQGISRRFKQRFPSLFAHQYHNDTFKFKYTKTQRAEASAKHFNKGIFHAKQLEDIYYEKPITADPVLRFYKDCKRWKKEVDKNPEAYEERVKFETGPTFHHLFKKLQERLGMEKPPSLEEVEIMYLGCSFESAWDPKKPSPWCNIFDEFDFQVLEYRQDIEYYWIDGYGYKLTYEQACPTIGDILQKINDKMEDESAPSVIAYFTHSGTLLKVISRLGLFNDSVPLLGDNFDHHRYSRKWRTSVIDPFATNIAFILFRCSEGYKVGMMFKERPMEQPLCGGKYLCTIDEFKDAMEPFVRNCDLPGMCRLQ